MLSRLKRVVAVTGAVCLAGALPLPADGAGSSVTMNIPVVPPIKSVSVSPSSFAIYECFQWINYGLIVSTGPSTGNQLYIPNGECGPAGIPAPSRETDFTITNTGTVPEAISVQGTDAVPSDGGTPWSLTSQPPGRDEFAMWNGLQEVFPLGLLQPEFITTTPTPDKAVEIGVGNKGILAPGVTQGELFGIEAPSASSDPSPQFSTTITWIAS